jgi:hypothetical protein
VKTFCDDDVFDHNLNPFFILAPIMKVSYEKDFVTQSYNKRNISCFAKFPLVSGSKNEAKNANQRC